MKRLLSFVLAGLIALGALVSCSESENTDDTVANPSSSDVAATPVDTAEETEEVDPFADVNYGGRTLTVYTSIDTTDATNGDAFIRGLGEYNGEAVNDAVYDRNMRVSEALGIKIEFIEADYYYDAVANNLKTQITAGDNTWQIIANDMRALANISADGYLRNVYNNGILNLDGEYWYRSAMEDLMFLDGGMYLIVGDYFTDAIASCHALYVNEQLLDSIFGDENYINTMAFEGTWTIDKMTELVEQCYADTDGNGTSNAGDRFGYQCVGMWGSAIPMLIAQDVTFVDKSDGTVAYAFNNERSIAVLDKLHSLYYSNGTLTTVSDVAALQTNFANGESVIMGYNRLGDLANLREVDFPYGVVVYPKFDENQDHYNTSLHDTTEIGAVPSNIVGDDLTFVLTCLEVLCRETGKTVIPEYYENGLKVKYADGQDDAKMVDLIHDSICSAFAVAYDQTLSNFLLRSVFLDPLANNSVNFSSTYAKFEKAADKVLTRTKDAFQGVLDSGN